MRMIFFSPKRQWIFVSYSFSLAAFDSGIKINFEEEALYSGGVPFFMTI